MNIHPAQLKHFNPALNVSLQAARILRERLNRLGFLVTGIVGQTVALPPGAGPNVTVVSQEVSEAELQELVPDTEPVFLSFDLAQNPVEDRIEAARVLTMLGEENDITDVQRLSGALYPGQPLKWLVHLFQIAGVVEAVNRLLRGAS